jgi:hypothetical protein
MFAIVGAPKGKLEPSLVETERAKLKFLPNGVDVTAQHLGKTPAVIGASPSKPAETPDMRDTTQDHTFIEKPRRAARGLVMRAEGRLIFFASGR